MKTPTFLLFVVLLILIIFVEGIMIIDQEFRIKGMKSKVEKVTGEVEETIDRANLLMNITESTGTTSQATSSDIKK